MWNEANEWMWMKQIENENMKFQMPNQGCGLPPSGVDAPQSSGWIS